MCKSDYSSTSGSLLFSLLYSTMKRGTLSCSNFLSPTKKRPKCKFCFFLIRVSSILPRILCERDDKALRTFGLFFYSDAIMGAPWFPPFNVQLIRARYRNILINHAIPRCTEHQHSASVKFSNRIISFCSFFNPWDRSYLIEKKGGHIP